MAARFHRRVVEHPWWTIAAVLVPTLLLAWRAVHVRFDNSIEALLPAGLPAVLQDREVKALFDSREMVLIGVMARPTVFHPRTLTKVAELSDAIWQVELADDQDARRLAAWADRVDPARRRAIAGILEGGLDATDRGGVVNLWLEVREDGSDDGLERFLDELRLKLAPVSDVLSLSEVEDVRASPEGLDIDPPMDEIPVSPEDLQALVRRVFDNEMFVGGLVSADSTATLVLVELAFHYDDHLSLAHDLFDELEALAGSFEGPEELRLAGVPMVNVYTSDYMNGDLVRLVPLALLVLLGVLYGVFRWWPGAFVPLAVVVVAVIWSLGAMQLAGRPVTLVVSAMPVILIAIGVADGVHLVSHYRSHLASGADGPAAVLSTMEELTGPIVVTSVTDMAGFGSLAFTGLASIRDFGVFTSFGALVALGVSLTLVPAALVLLPRPGVRPDRNRGARLRRVLGRVADAAGRRRPAVVLGALGFTAAALLTLPRIQVGSTMLGYFHEDSEIYRSSEMINERFGGTEVLNIVVDTRTPGGLKKPATLARIAALQDTLEARELVGYTTSVADYVARIHRVMNGGDPAFSRIPLEREPIGPMESVSGDDGEARSAGTVPGRQLVAQYLLLYESAGGEGLTKLVDLDYRKANIVAQIRTDRTPLLREIRAVAAGFAEREFGSGAEVTFAGCSNLCIVADDLIIPSQLRSLGIAVLLVLVLLAGLFRSVRLGALAVLPLLLTVLSVFAILALTGVFLDAVTALIASIVLGVGIDYAVHFVARYRRLLARGSSAPDAIRRSATQAGPPILLNSAAVASGFLVLAFSSFWPIVHIGWIVAVTMVGAAVLTLVLLPATLPREGMNGPHRR